LHLHTDSNQLFSVILQPVFPSGARRTIGHSFHTTINPNMLKIRNIIEPHIESFEQQSGDGLGQDTYETYVSVIIVTDYPEPNVLPTYFCQCQSKNEY
jgi:hypothetical protein